MESSVRAFDLFLIEQAAGAVGVDVARRPLYIGDRVNWIDHNGISRHGEILEYRVSKKLGFKVLVKREEKDSKYPMKITFSTTKRMLKMEKNDV